MSVGVTGALVGLGIASAGAGVASSVIGSKAATSAAKTESQAQQAAIDEQRRQFDISQGNARPFIEAGQNSIGKIMEAIQNGTFGAGSLGRTGAAPEFTGEFHTPTLDEARNTPGYQFTADAGSKAIARQASAGGRSLSGGVLQSLDRFNTGLADSTYNDVFNRSMSTYDAGLRGYQAKLAGYGANIAGLNENAQLQGREFEELLAPAQIGSGSTAQLGQLGAQNATSIGQLMAGIGQSNAAGQVGSANAITGGIGSAVNGVSQSFLLSQLLKPKAAPAGTYVDELGLVPG